MAFFNIYPKNEKILLIGSYPPPIGGVSIHVKRLHRLLIKKGHNIDIFHNSPICKSRLLNSIRLFYKIVFRDYQIVHINGYYKIFILIAHLLKYTKQYRIFYTDHNPRLFEGKNRISKYLIGNFIENLDYLILVGDHILDKYKENNIKLPKNLIVQNAFLPPPLEEKDQIVRTYSSETIDFLFNQKPLVIASAWKIVFSKSIDLYGLDMCIELTSRLKKDFPQIGFIFALANDDTNIKYIGQMRERIIHHRIENNFHFMSGQKELWPIFKMADLYIRPTVTDGDAISIREAMYFNCPVVASDAVHRPNGIITFKSRDIEDLYGRVSEILQNSRQEERRHP